VKEILSSNRNQTKLLRWFGSIIAVILLIILSRQQGWTEILDAFQEISIGRYLVCLSLLFISRFAVVGRWHSLISAVEDLSFWDSTRITFAGLFASNFLPTTVGGDVVRFAATAQMKCDNVVSAASLIVDRLIGMFGMLLALPFGIRPLVVWFYAGRIAEIKAQWGFSMIWSSRLYKKGVDLFQRLYRDVMVWAKHPRTLLLSLIYTGIHMLCLFSAIYLLLDDLGEFLNLGIVGGLWSFVYLITLLPISINGYGVQEISMAFIFSEVGGISLQSGLTVSILIRTLMLLGSLPGAIFVPGIIVGIKENKQFEQEK
jgi:uncharacterized membrane protein YbhN (UPF0104 family)